MPFPYSKAASSVDLFFEILHASNPGLSSEVNKNNVDIGTPTAITPVGSLNTEVIVTPKSGVTTITGSKTLRYTRLSLNLYLPSNGATNTGCRKIWGSPASLNISADASPFGVQYRAKVATRFGLFWENPTDFTLSALLTAYTANSNTLTFSAASSNLCYTGSCIINFGSNNYNVISNVYTNKIISDDISFSDNPEVVYRLLAMEPTLELMDSAVDVFGNLDLFTNVTLTSAHQAFFDVINTLTGLDLQAGIDLSTGGETGIGGQYAHKYGTTDPLVYLSTNGVAQNADMNAALRTILNERYSRVLVIRNVFTGWQKTGLIIPLIPYNF